MAELVVNPTIDASFVSERALVGGIALGARQVLVQALNIAGMIALARILGPAEFGWYAVGAFALAVMSTLGDVGLGASLVRSSTEPAVREWHSVFGVQLLLATVGASLLFIGAPTIAGAYGFSDQSLFFRLLSPAIVLATFQSMATVQMERALNFRAVAVIEVVQAFVFNVAAVALALAGFGVLSIAVAISLRALVGAALGSRLAAWPWGVAIDIALIRPHLTYGVPFQASSLISLARWSITPVFVGLLLGPKEVGYIYWAQTVSTYAVVGLMIMQRLYLPVFARLQHRPNDLAALVDRSVLSANAIVAPASVILLVLIAPITRLVYGDQWLPALPLFFVLWIANLLAATSTPLLGLLNALGHTRVTLAFTVLWMLGTWALGAPLIVAFGGIGYAYASAAIQVSNLALFATAKRYVHIHLLRNAAPAWLIAGVAGVVTAGFATVVSPTSAILVLIEGGAGVAVFLLLFALLHRSGAMVVVGYVKNRARARWT